MEVRAGAPRRYGVAAAVVVVAAGLVRVLTLPLTPPELALEGGLWVAVLGFVLTSLRLEKVRWGNRGLLLVLYALAPSLLAALALRIAAPVLPEYTMIATLLFAAVIVSIDVGAPRWAMLAAGAAVIAVFVQLWLSTVSSSGSEIASMMVAVGLLAGLGLIVVAQSERVRTRLDVEGLRGRVFATMARHLGTERDVFSVATAVLSACKEMFPEATYGAVMLVDESDGLLKTPGIVLGPDGIGTGGPMLELTPGEGLAGAIVAGGRPMVWPTALEVSSVEASLREVNRVRLREAHAGYLRCAIGTPLLPPGSGVIGCVFLASHTRETVWSAADLTIMQAIADESSRAIERARRHEADVDQALLDSVTGLVSHRRLLNVVDKEVSRAARTESTVAIIFSDLDDFKEINDAWGHDAGNRVLVMYADVLRAALRREDTAARYGGDEFVCVLPGADRDQAIAVAERVQNLFAEGAGDDPVVGTSNASVSYGIAVFPVDASSGDAALAAADAELIRAKKRRARVLTGRARRRRTKVDTSAETVDAG